MAIKQKCSAWVRLARLQFYPFGFVIYTMGVAIAYMASQRFDPGVYVLGYICIFLIELVTVFTNEYFDYPTDHVNKNAGVFNGGSRVLVEGKLGCKEVKVGIFVVLSLIPVFGYLLIRTAGNVSPYSILFLLLLGIFLGLGYSVPPLKFSYLGLGEIISSFVLGPLVILAGYVFQTGTWGNPLPWLLSTPLFFAELGAATFAAIPDYHADMAVSRKTIPVVFGARMAVILSICFISIAAITGIVLWYCKLIAGLVAIILFAVIPPCVGCMPALVHLKGMIMTEK
jgi:1,4-dihydroxy-2-naphthoate octaprenyltransferase